MSKEKEKIDNPFVTTGYVSAEYFCDREKETQDKVNKEKAAVLKSRQKDKNW